MTTVLNNLLPHIDGYCFHCRPGFEHELQLEFQYRSKHIAITGDFRNPTPGLLRWVGTSSTPLGSRNLKMLENLNHWWPQWIFARQQCAVFAELSDINTKDRISDLLNALPPYLKLSALLSETSDTNEGKSLNRLTKALEPRLQQGLRDRNHWLTSSPWQLHLVFYSGSHVLLGLSQRDHASAWSNGIPRLKMPVQAPSRSTLKLDEALQLFLNNDECTRLLKPGYTAVDLGASPGGWTWQMIQRGLLVTAVDHGPMQAELMQSGMVEHLRTDGFVYRPKQSVDWLLCDMVEQPRRIAQLLVQWIRDDKAKAIIANLKLPMKKRWDEVQLCLDMLHQAIAKHRPHARLRARQLYHDREEITVVILPPAP